MGPRPRGSVDPRRRGPGAGRQDRVAQGRAAPTRAGRLRRSARARPGPPPLAPAVRGGAGPRPSVRRRAPRLLRDRGGARPAGRRGDDLLHVGHHRRPEGRDADARQRDPYRPGLPGGRGRPRRRRVALVPADGLGRRLDLLARHEPGGGLRLQLPREPRDRAARPPRARADHRAGAAADLGEHADRGPGARGRRLAAQAPCLRALPRGRRAGRDPARRRPARALGPPARLRPRRDPGLPAGAGSAGTPPGALGLHGRRAARPRHVPLLPRLRRQPEAGLRLDRGLRARLDPAGR